ncbi:sensor histidine kinase [Kibdelosporangium persicum]|uniref:Oxygen sensor histidine kinase NreB n=1 Tax=Kibdelosporangium persicum TaxID=2698649 RepID=A0ABX2F552_9PSEU|nr:sensor histidine kinase [Kibdelosporangium persicum]NRN66469.1 Integral membrane sensor signal transduction histidine kinase [Kibdelosporangium persicum]
MRKLNRYPERVADTALAAAVAGVLIALHWPWLEQPAALGAIVAGCLLLVWRRRFPIAVCVLSGTALALTIVSHMDASGPLLLITWIALYGVPAYAAPRLVPVVGGSVVLATALLLVYLVGASDNKAQYPFVAPIMLAIAYLATAWLLGTYHRTRRAYLAALEERTARLERERDAVARQAVAEERTWIARELHDMLAHTISGMVVLAGGARRAAKDRPEDAIEALTEIEQVGRDGMAETRTLLESLRGNGEPATPPQATLRELPTLADRMRSSGLSVHMSVTGDPVHLPVPVDLAAYRIVQEALTNTLRHAGTATAQVSIQYTMDELQLEITDDGRNEAEAGTGLGLAGMRERARLLGGELRAGPAPGHGWSVRARLPLRATTGVG